MDPANKVRPISGENTEAALKRLLQLAQASGSAPRPSQPFASPEIRRFAIRLLKTVCSESDEGAQLRKAIRGMIEGGEQLFTIIGEKEGAPRP